MNKTQNIRYVLLIAVLALSVAMVVPRPASAQAVDNPWPMWRHDPAHSGTTTTAGPTHLFLSWKFPTDGPVVSSPSLVGGKAYFGSNDGYIYCVDAVKGQLIWKFQTGFLARGSPAVDNGKVFTGPDDGNIYCLDANTGALIWKTPTVGGLIKTVLQPTAQIHSSPCVIDGRVFVGHLDGYMYCLNETNGATIWKYKPIGGDRIVSSPAVVGGYVYYGCCDGNVYKLQESNGKFLWKFYTDLNPPEGVLKLPSLTEVDASPMVNGGVVYVFSNSGYWFAINATDGTQIWNSFILKYRGAYSVTQSIPVGSMAYFNGKTYQAFGYYASAFDAKTGDMLWNKSIGYPSYSSAAIASGKVYLASDLPAIYSFDAENGTRYSTFVMQSNIHSSPSIAYGNLYVGCFDWNLYCLIEHPPKQASAITETIISTKVQLGSPLNISGSITPSPGATSVTVTLTLPGGSTKTLSTAANSDGTYLTTYIPDTNGVIVATASWSGNDLYSGGSSSPQSFTVPPPPPPQPPRIVYSSFLVAAILAIAIAIIAQQIIASRRKE